MVFFCFVLRCSVLYSCDGRWRQRGKVRLLFNVGAACFGKKYPDLEIRIALVRTRVHSALCIIDVFLL